MNEIKMTKYTIINNTEYKISDSVRELLELYIDEYNASQKWMVLSESFKIIVGTKENFIKFEINMILGEIKYKVNKLYIHKELINTTNHLFWISNNMGFVIIYSINIKYCEDYMSLIDENKINEYYTPKIIPFKFKEIISNAHKDKYLHRYTYTL